MTASPANTSSSGHRLLSAGWSTPENVSASTTRHSAKPVVLVDHRGVTHVLWEEDNRIYYRQRVQDKWSRPEALITGMQPAAAIDSRGTLYVLYTSEFGNQLNIFSLRLVNNLWSLPRMVSRTRGASAFPAVTVDRQGVLHAVWADRTPGYSVIYHGWLEEDWLYEPLTNARGTAPALAADPSSGVLHIVWQAPHVSQTMHEVYHAQGATYTWSTPENISASPQTDSVGIAMACDQAGLTHLAWQELVGGRFEIRYANGQQGNWSTPETVSGREIEAVNPTMAVTHGNQLNLIWREGNTVVYRRRSGNDGSWRSSKPLIANDAGLEDLAVAADAEGTFHVVWTAWTGSAESDIFHSTGKPALGSQVFLPATAVNR